MIPNPPNMLTWACALMRLNLPKPLNMHALWQFHFTNLQNYSYMYTKICNCWLQQYLYACQCWRYKINTCENCTELKKNEVRSGHWALHLRPGLNRHPQLPVDAHSGSNHSSWGSELLPPAWETWLLAAHPDWDHRKPLGESVCPVCSFLTLINK